jgi:hypothetical protein
MAAIIQCLDATPVEVDVELVPLDPQVIALLHMVK